MIQLTGVSKRYDGGGDTFAVRELSLHVPAGTMMVLLGESGCGKTTTLKMVNRLIEPTSGRIQIDGHDVTSSCGVQLRRGIGYVFQGVGLFPHMTIARNVSVGPELLQWPKDRIRARVDELLDLVGLAPAAFGGRYPRELSGGQRQRVGVARALAAEPRIMLMDEPFGALDPLTRDDLQKAYRRIHDRLGLTSMMVTHDITEALLMADRIAVMRGGAIVREGTPHELLSDPGDDYVAALMAKPREQADRVETLLSMTP